MSGSSVSQNPDENGKAPKQLSIKANMIWNSAGSMTYLACQWLVTIVVVRLSSGYDDAGLLSLAMSVVGIFGTFANYKMGTYQVSDINRENSLSEYLGFRCLMLAGSFVACMVYTWLTCTSYAMVPVALYFAFRAVGLVIDILHGEDQINRRMDYIGKSFMLQGAGMLVSFSIAYGLTQNLNIAIVAMIVWMLLVLGLFDIPHCSQFAQVKVSVSLKKVLFFLRTSLPAVIASVAASTLFTIPKQYLAVASGDAALGIYASVAAPALIIQMGAQYLYVPLLDVFPRLFFEGKIKQFGALLAKTLLGILGVTMACAIVLEFIGGWALGLLFGESITPYVYLLQPIIISTAATALLWFFGDLLITLRRFWGNFAGNVVSFLAVIPLSFFCVDRWDMNGVSFAGAIACILGVLVLSCFLVDAIRKGPDRIIPACRQSGPSSDAEGK